MRPDSDWLNSEKEVAGLFIQMSLDSEEFSIQEQLSHRRGFSNELLVFVRVARNCHTFWMLFMLFER